MGRYVAFAELSELERAVGQRLRAARTRIRLSQTGLAALVGLTRDQINNVELGRVALRFEAGWNICLELNLNPLWLLTGEGESKGFVDMSGTSEIFGDVLFTAVMEGMSRPDSLGGWGYAEWREHNLRKPPLGKIRLANESPLAKSLITRQPQAALPPVRKDLQNVTPQLTLHENVAKVRAMQLKDSTHWPDLRRKLKRLVRKRGMKSGLAREVGLTRQAINAMLSDSRERPYVPSAEYALRLRHWVDAAEGKTIEQKKRGGRAVTRPPLKTRERKPTKYEKSKSDRKKK